MSVLIDPDPTRSRHPPSVGKTVVPFASVVGLVCVALNLRASLVALPPLMQTIRSDLSLGHVGAGMLTTLPTICFGLFAFAAAWTARRYSLERIILAAIVVVGLGTAARLVSHTAFELFATTATIGVGIAFAQTLLPAYVKSRFSERTGFAIGLYTTVMSLAAMVSGGTSALLAERLGSWQASLAFWSLLAVAGVAGWLPMLNSAKEAAAVSRNSRHSANSSLPLFSASAWVITIFCGCSSGLYLSVLAWYPPLYQEHGWSGADTGYLLTAFNVFQMVGSFGVPVLADKFGSSRLTWFVFSLSIDFLALLWLALAPMSAPWALSATLGVGVGSIFALSLTLPLDHSKDAAAAARLNAMAQGFGYLLAACGPFLLGWLRETTGSYRTPFLALAAVCLAMTLLICVLQLLGTSRNGAGSAA